MFGVIMESDNNAGHGTRELPYIYFENHSRFFYKEYGELSSNDIIDKISISVSYSSVMRSGNKSVRLDNSMFSRDLLVRALSKILGHIQEDECL
jgi:hypothetical protein